jgi:hypothetical protein
MLTLHNEFKPEISPGEPIGAPAENPTVLAAVIPPVTAETNPLTPAEAKREDQFEKALADPEAPAPFHMNVYARTFLGGLLFLSLIAFYASHISGYGSLGTYGQAPYPSDVNRLTHH